MSEQPTSPQSFGEKLYKNRTGIMLGGLLGLFIGHSLIGVLVGAVAGFMLQRSFSASVMSSLNPQNLFFQATFAVMGRIAKADGRVTEEEIAYARNVMDRMRLSEEKRQEAMELFSKGKDPDFDIDSLLKPLARVIRFRPDVKQMFVEIQLQAAFVDQQASQHELQVIQEICQTLQLSYQDLQNILNRSRSEHAFHQHNYQSGAQGYQPGQDPRQLLKEAYGVLGVEEAVSDTDLKRAYRKLMSQHHPDKLIAKGLPEEMMQLAKEKTQEIQAAYDRVREYRKDNK